ncbi:MAG: FISUMP domain-containing protein [Candidatus Marinimicrobia bacterium]|nr:FISUMP domain-containing protein [Candidatus Neomarinimicrobiota bacterium]
MNQKRLFILFVTILALVMLSVFSCEEVDESDSIETDPELLTIVVTPNSTSLTPGDTQVFTATGKDVDNNTLEDIVFTWTSNNPATAEIDDNGLLTAIANGNTYITAESGDIVSDHVTITVTQPVATIEILQESLSIYLDSTDQFTAIAKDSEGNEISDISFTWVSNNPSVASISGDGTVTGISLGTAQITASSGDISSTTATINVMELTSGTVTDIDGNVYQTIKIGDQWWMAENLRTTHYRNGDPITRANDAYEWRALAVYNAATDDHVVEGGYCFYDFDSTNGSSDGLFYNWLTFGNPTPQDGNDNLNIIAPEGWRVPGENEWHILKQTVGMTSEESFTPGYNVGTNEGSKLAGNAELWEDGALKDDPEFGDSMLNLIPSGYLSSYTYDFSSKGEVGMYWTNYINNSFTDPLIDWQPYSHFVLSSQTYIVMNSSRNTNVTAGLAIRCVKEEDF